MSKIHSFMDDSHDSDINTEKNSVECTSLKSKSKGFSLHRNHRFDKIGFKSLTALNAKDSLENLQKIRRRNDGSRRIFFNRISSDKRAARKKYGKKRFDKPHVSEVNIRKVTHDFLDGNNKDKLVSIISAKEFGAFNDKANKNPDNLIQDVEIADESNDFKISESMNDPPVEIIHGIENLLLGENSEPHLPDFDQAQSEASGDAQNDHFSLDTGYNGARAHVLDSKRRSVQWNHEVDVIYYAGTNDSKVVRRGNEPLREETEQQARRKKFIQMALTKNLMMSEIGTRQLHDPWLAVLPK